MQHARRSTNAKHADVRKGDVNLHERNRHISGRSRYRARNANNNGRPASRKAYIRQTPGAQRSPSTLAKTQTQQAVNTRNTEPRSKTGTRPKAARHGHYKNCRSSMKRTPPESVYRCPANTIIRYGYCPPAHLRETDTTTKNTQTYTHNR